MSVTVTPRYPYTVAMCRFWFTEFLEYTKEYEAILRIIGDCVLEPNIEVDPDPGPDTMMAAARIMRFDKPSVILGMAGLFPG